MRLVLFIANVSGTIYSPTKEVIAYIRFLLCLCFSLSAVFAVYNHAEEKYSKMIFMTKHRMDRALIEDKQGNRIHTHAHINPKNHGIGFDWSLAINLPCVSAPVSLCLHWSVTRGGIGWFRFWTALYVCVCVCVCVLWKEREESNIIKHDKPLVFFLFLFFYLRLNPRLSHPLAWYRFWAFLEEPWWVSTASSVCSVRDSPWSREWAGHQYADNALQFCSAGSVKPLNHGGICRRENS